LDLGRDVVGQAGAPQVLVVEDDERSRKLAVTVLRAGGFEVAAAGCGLDALAACAARRPDVVLLDVQLPDLQGPDVLARLRADARLASLPVVAVTAFAMASDRERLLAAGFDGLLTKPIDVPTFAATVRSFLRDAA
jgi:two-component system cell cycle response regulator DivK